jgi:hypothetical protein
MTDLYQINEIAQQKGNDDKKNTGNGYQSDVTNLSAINLFVKAVQRALDKVSESVEILGQIKDPNGTAENRSLEDSNRLVKFVEGLDLAMKIVDEFQKGTSILNDNTPELVDLFTKLNDAFSIVKLRISMFSITKDMKYAESSKETLNIILELFKNMRNSIINATQSQE